jgi:hypothetical protein
MTHIEVLWTIGSIGSIIALFIAVFMWFHINPQQLTRFFIARRRTIFNVTYITVISAFTIFYISLLTYITVVLRVSSFQWALLWVIVAFSTVGLWSPVLMSQRVWGGRFRRIVNWVMLAFSIIILVGFWIISWPTDLLKPSILTGIAVTALITYYLHRYWSRIKAKTIQCRNNVQIKAKQCWDNVKIKTMQYWHIIGTRFHKGSSS